MTREETKEAIKVMQHFVDGGEIEYCVGYIKNWFITKDPVWDFHCGNYRIKVKEPVKPEIGKWYNAPFGNGYIKQKCIAFDLGVYVFMSRELGTKVYLSDHDFSNFKEVGS